MKKHIFLLFALIGISIGTQAQISRNTTEFKVDSLLPDQNVKAITPVRLQQAFRKVLDYVQPSNFTNLSIDLSKLAPGIAISGQVIKWNGSAWVPANDATGTPTWGSVSGSLSNQTDLTAALAAKEAAIVAGTIAQYMRGDKSWATLDKSAVGLSNVDNTSDANKPISSATITALAGKQNAITLGTAAQYFKGDLSLGVFDKAALNLGNVDNTSDANKPLSSATILALAGKEPTITTGSLNLDKFAQSSATSGQVIKWNGSAWVPSADATGGAPAWGGISGTLSSQADLAAALAAKQATITTGTTAQYFKGDLSLGTLDKAAVGLGNVDNTSDANKPISTATATALAGKQAAITTGTAAQYFKGDLSLGTLDKSAVGLGNVDNTSDANKPISSATVTALAGKEPSITTGSLNLNKLNQSGAATGQVPKWDGLAWVPSADNAGAGVPSWGVITGTLSSQTDLAAALAAKQPTITTGTTAQYFKGDLSLGTFDKAAIGLGNVDNTTDLNKPISTATATALAGKQASITTGTAAQYFKGDLSLGTFDKAAIGLGNVDNTSDLSKPISTATATALAGKQGTITTGTAAQYFKGDLSLETLDKSAVGLGNVDNTSDANKPISTATQAALDARILSVSNVAALRGITGVAGQIVRTKGFYTGGDGGSNVFFWNTTSTLTDNGGFVVKATATATGRWIAADQSVANLLRFGAVGDGVTNSTTAIQTALATGRQAFAPKGTYLVNAEMPILNNVLCEMDAVFKVTDGYSGTVFSVKSKKQLTLKGLYIDAQGTGISCTGLRIEGLWNSVIENYGFIANATDVTSIGVDMTSTDPSILPGNPWGNYVITFINPYIIRGNTGIKTTKTVGDAVENTQFSILGGWVASQSYAAFDLGYITNLVITNVATDVIYGTGYIFHHCNQALIHVGEYNSGMLANVTDANSHIKFFHPTAMDLSTIITGTNYNSQTMSRLRLNATSDPDYNVEIRSNYVYGTPFEIVGNFGGGGERQIMKYNYDGLIFRAENPDNSVGSEMYGRNAGGGLVRLGTDKYSVGTAAPTTGTWTQGDYRKNYTPSELGTSGSKYVITGWICVGSGTPGTWVEQRGLTGN